MQFRYGSDTVQLCGACDVTVQRWFTYGSVGALAWVIVGAVLVQMCVAGVWFRLVQIWFSCVCWCNVYGSVVVQLRVRVGSVV